MWNKEMIRSVTIFFSYLMAHNAIKSDCHYLQIHLASPPGLFDEKCSLYCALLVFVQTRSFSQFSSFFFFKYYTSVFTFWASRFYFLVCQCVFFLPFLIFEDLFLCLRPVGRFLTRVALVEPSSGIKSQGERQALSHYAGASSPGFDWE